MGVVGIVLREVVEAIDGTQEPDSSGDATKPKRVDCCKREVGTASVEPEQDGADRGDYPRRVRAGVVGDRTP